MRKRNIQITTHRMKPRTRFYVFFDNVDVTRFVTPKLLEIKMTKGVFQVGELVVGTILTNLTGGFGPTNAFKFRVAQQNHKELQKLLGKQRYRHGKEKQSAQYPNHKQKKDKYKINFF